MDIRFPSVDIALQVVAPELAITITAILVLLTGLRNQRAAVGLSLAGLAVTAGFILRQAGTQGSSLNKLYVVDSLTVVVQLILVATAALAIGMAGDYLQRRGIRTPEYYALVLFAVCGAMVMAATGNLIVLFIGMEIMSLSMYVLAGLDRQDRRSEEAALKYLLLGAFGSGFLVYGMSLWFGATGDLNLSGVTQLATDEPQRQLMLYASMALLLVGFGFKAALVPFHMWAPDVYTGAPVSSALFMACTAKVAAFTVLLRLAMNVVDSPASPVFQTVVVVLALITMTWGNLAALAQRDVKRILGYSSISHAGYLMAAVAVTANMALAFYFAAYVLMTVGAFTVVGLTCVNGEEQPTVERIAGLAARQPWSAFALAVFMFSMIGIPGTAGFMGKLLIIWSVIATQTTIGIILAVTLVLNSVIAAFYYLRVVRSAYFSDPAQTPMAPVSMGSAVVLTVCAIGTLLLGLFPSSAFTALQSALSPVIRWVSLCLGIG